MLSRAGLWLGLCLALALVGCWPRAVEQDGLARRASRESDAKWALALLLAGVASVVVQRRYFTYHALVLAPLAVLAAAFGLQRCLAARRGRTLTLLFAAVSSAMVWGSSSSYVEFVASRLLPYARGRITEREYDRSFKGLFGFDYETSAELAALVLSRAPRTSDGFHVRGYETPSYVLTGLRSPTRFFMEGYVSGYYAGFDPSWAEAHEAQLRANPPRFFAAALDERAEIARLEREGYGRIGARGRFLLFERGIEPRPMRRAAVVSAATDHAYEGTAFAFMPLALHFSADGTARARVGSSSYDGSWRVSRNGQLCFTPRDGSARCALVFSRPWGLLAFTAENHEICAVSEKK
jgi:hypothetical protein